MSVVVSRSSVPRARCAVSPSPGEVLFKRGVSAAGGPATGDEAKAGCGALSSCVVARVSRGIPVAYLLGALRTARHGVGSVAYELEVEPALAARVASSYPLRAYPTVRFGSPASTLPLVLRSLRRRAAAAKVLRGRRRLGEATPTVMSRQSQAAYAGRVDLPAPARCLQFGQSASRLESPSSVAFASLVPVLRKLPAQSRPLQ